MPLSKSEIEAEAKARSWYQYGLHVTFNNISPAETPQDEYAKMYFEHGCQRAREVRHAL
jgi:hypothetical protein